MQRHINYILVLCSIGSLFYLQCSKTNKLDNEDSVVTNPEPAVPSQESPAREKRLFDNFAVSERDGETRLTFEKCPTEVIASEHGIVFAIDEAVYEFQKGQSENKPIEIAKSTNPHSFVFDGPIFKTPIIIEKGEVVYKEYKSHSKENPDEKFGFWYCDLI